MNKYKKKKIVFILPSLNGGGAERVVLTLLSHINREKFDPILILLTKEGRYLNELPSFVKVVDLAQPRARYAIFSIYKKLKEINPDIVFSTLGHLNLFMAIIRPLFSKEVKFISRESNTVSIQNKREKYPKIFDFLYSHVYSNFDHIIAQANSMKNDLVENYGIEDSKITVIYNPIDIEKIEKMSNEKLDIVLDKEKINLIVAGRLSYQKGFDYLLDAFAKLTKNYHLYILGEGEDEEDLKAQAKALEIDKRVTFVGFDSNVYKYMKNCDLYVLSSRYEGLPNVVLEANICQIPVVAFDGYGGTNELIKDGFNGFLVKAYDIDKLSDMIVFASSYNFDLKEVKEEFEERFHIQKIVKLYEEIFVETSFDFM